MYPYILRYIFPTSPMVMVLCLYPVMMIHNTVYARWIGPQGLIKKDWGKRKFELFLKVEDQMWPLFISKAFGYHNIFLCVVVGMRGTKRI